MKYNIIKGSLQQIALSTNQPLAKVLLKVDCVIIIDVSSSMDERDPKTSETYYTTACRELETLQGQLAGRIALIAFNDTPTFCPQGTPPKPKGLTDLAKALEFAKTFDVSGVRFILISDGEPNSEEQALKVAQTYKNRIDVIFVGAKGSTGERFLQSLATVKNGQSMTADTFVGLYPKIQGLLTASA